MLTNAFGHFSLFIEPRAVLGSEKRFALASFAALKFAESVKENLCHLLEPCWDRLQNGMILEKKISKMLRNSDEKKVMKI